MVGRTILHYKILKEIGKGGMGVVYKAKDTKLHRIVAIKALAAELVGDDKARTRFLREARAASAIDHPNICTVYEINEVEDLLFFVMPYVEGKTLKKYINGRPLPLNQALDFSLQLIDALAEAHHRNVLHRDIKAANLMINERGQVKILDFGLAKLTRPSGEDSHIINELTQLGTPFGTASYMSPEQAKGEAADARSDIFSAGTVMYEMITGHLPFRGKNSVEVMHAVLHDEPEPLGEGAPLRLQQIIAKALAKDKNVRYQNADALLDDLRDLVRSHYAVQGNLNTGMSASLRASTQPMPKSKSFAGRIAGLFKGLTKAPPPVREESSDSLTPLPDYAPAIADGAPSIWQSTDKKALAIMPFKNLSGNPDNDFYSFSLADCVITELAQIRDLIVRPSSYIAQFQNKEIDPRAIGTQLAVDAVLISSYLKAGDRFRVTPQLVDVSSGEILWSEKIDVSAKDIITVQDTISRLIVEGLRVKTTSKEEQRLAKKAPTENAEAYEHYLKGRTLLYKFITQTLNVEDLEQAIAWFAQAIDGDGEFALAHSGLGVCYLNYVLKGIGGMEYYTRAQAAFNTALALDSKLIEPRVRLVYIDLIEGNSEVARQEIRRLLKRAPNEPSVHSAAAYVYRLSGQYEKALEQWAALLKISPTDVVFASYNRARIYGYMRDLAQAKSEIARGKAFEPNHPNLKTYSAVLAYEEGDYAKAAKIMEEVLAKNPELYAHRLYLAHSYVALGERQRASDLIDEKVIETARADQDVAYRLASFYALDGQEDEAIEWLEKAVAMGNENYPWFAVDPKWEKLRAHEEYKMILASLKEKWEKLQEPVS
ncbi:MAG: protein kinase [Acidobacteria bacterium]|nr:protein kinase [Acidobacteriota bacterium]